jgi:hypothetical protein
MVQRHDLYCDCDAVYGSGIRGELMQQHRASRALSPHALEVPLYVGQDSSIDPRVLQTGAQAVVENGQLYYRGQVRKRYGFTQLTAPATAANTVFQMGPGLYHHDGSLLRAYIPSQGTWQTLGSVCGAALRTVAGVQAVSSAINCVTAQTASTYCVAWLEGTAPFGNLYCQVVDSTTQSLILPRTFVAAGVCSPSVIAVGGKYIVAYQLGNSVFYYDTALGLVFGTPLSVNGAPGSYTLVPGTTAGPTYTTSFFGLSNASAGIFQFTISTSISPAYNTWSQTLYNTVPSTTGYVSLVPPDPNNAPGLLALVASTSSTGCYQATGGGGSATLTSTLARTITRAMGVSTGFGWATLDDGALYGLSVYGLALTIASYAAWPGLAITSLPFTTATDAYVWAKRSGGIQSLDVLLNSANAIVGIAGANGEAAPGDGYNYATSQPAGDGNGNFLVGSATISQITATATVPNIVNQSGVVRQLSFGQQALYGQAIAG